MKTLHDILYGEDNFLVTRPGLVEIDALYEDMPTQKLHDNAGFYCETGNVKEIFGIWKQKYIDSMKNSDKVVVVPQWYLAYLEKKAFPIFERFNIKPKQGIETYPLDPKFYIDYLEFLTKNNRKVLVIFPFKDSLEVNLKKMDQIYPSNSIKTENIDVVKTYQSIRGNVPHRNWLETYNKVIEEVNKKDFDVALLSCGCYGQPIADHIYSNMNNSAFYVGGLLQVLFGILGRRWVNNTEVKPYVTASWSVPLESERPVNYQKIERGCYW